MSENFTPENQGFSSYGQPQERRSIEARRQETPAADPPSKPARGSSSSTAADFSGPLTNLQVKLPLDLVQSLKLLSIQQNRPMSAIVLECLTTETVIAKCWIASRRAG